MGHTRESSKLVNPVRLWGGVPKTKYASSKGLYTRRYERWFLGSTPSGGTKLRYVPMVKWISCLSSKQTVQVRSLLGIPDSAPQGAIFICGAK
jgi:hypothetical protein